MGHSMRTLTLCATAILAVAELAQAQGLIRNLPDDGTWVRYEGTYRETVFRPESTEGDLQLEWLRHIEIKSVGREEATHDLDNDGNEVTEMCRWLEFKIQTGNGSEGVIDTGPGALRIYKVLVPESAVRTNLVDPEGIFLAYLPVVKGYRKLGDEPQQLLKSRVLQIYPGISLLRHFRNLDSDGTEQNIDVPTHGSVTAATFAGDLTSETAERRTTNAGEIVASDEMPFGIVRWTAKATREQKNPTEPRTAFREYMELTEELTALEVGTDAETELITE